VGSLVTINGREAHSEIPPPYLDSLMYYARRAPHGAIVEVGVYKGGSALMLASLGRPLFLYDTFEGMPYAGELDTANPVGKFADTSAEAVQALIPQARVIKGLFPQSLVPMPPIGFVHADADQYESTKAILDTLPQRMVSGGMILFDDFAVDGCEGCTKAVQESKFPVLIVGETGKALIIV
jgi:O-methyltransferase